MVLGLRCSAKDYAWAVLDGKKSSPQLIAQGLVLFPKNFARPQSVVWFSQEVDGILNTHPCGHIVLKAHEGRVRDNSFLERIENETAVYFSASIAKKAVKTIVRKGKRTIAKDLGLKGQGKYLATLDTSAIANFDKLEEKVREAILSAWTALP